MTTNDAYVAFVAAYEKYDDAQAAFIKLREDRSLYLHLTAATVRKDDNGRLHLHQRTKLGKEGAVYGAIGAAVGAVVFAPVAVAAIPVIAVASAGLGTIGHFAGGLSRDELKKLGDLLDAGQGAVIAVTTTDFADQVDTILADASEKGRVDVNQDDVDAALADLATEVAGDGVGEGTDASDS